MKDMPDEIYLEIMLFLAAQGPEGIRSLARLCVASQRAQDFETRVEYRVLDFDYGPGSITPDRKSSTLALPSMSWIAPRMNRIQQVVFPRDLDESYAYIWSQSVEEHDIVEMIIQGMPMLQIPEHLLTRELCLSCVELNGENLRFVPYNIRTDAFQVEAAMTNAWAFGFISDHLRTEELLIRVIKSTIDSSWDPCILDDDWAIPGRFRTQAVRNAAAGAV